MIEIKDLRSTHFPNIVCKELQLKAGEVLKVEGPSGVGKTSFLKSLVKLRHVSYERYLFKGLEVGQIALAELRKAIVYVSQVPVQGPVKVKELYQQVSCFHANDEKFNNKLLQHLGMTDLLEKSINDLSGGQKQIVSLNLALELNPKVLLLDETMNGVDESRARKIVDYFKQSKPDLLILYISHHQTPLDKIRTGKILLKAVGQQVLVEHNGHTLT
jgi:putative ABC transport system ATP-binding protein